MSVTGDQFRNGPIGQRADYSTAAPTTVIGTIEGADDQGAVSWGAIFAGAVAAASLSLILLLLGTGLGLSSVSPWAYEGVTAETFGWSTIGWIAFTSIAASGLGGYLAGRLRTKWVSVHRDESFFRDTAHGFLSWAVATLLTAGLLTSAIGSILGTGAKAVASVAGSAASSAAAAGLAAASPGTTTTDGQGSPVDYWVDSLFRTTASGPMIAAESNTASSSPDANSAVDSNAANADSPAPAANANPSPNSAGRGPMDPGTSRAEVVRIFIKGLGDGEMDAADAEYIAALVARRTGMSTSEAQARVSDVQARMKAALDEAETTARETADEVRKASAYAALWLFITLLTGAFFASLFATFGGRQRDA